MSENLTEASIVDAPHLLPKAGKGTKVQSLQGLKDMMANIGGTKKVKSGKIGDSVIYWKKGGKIVGSWDGLSNVGSVFQLPQANEGLTEAVTSLQKALKSSFIPTKNTIGSLLKHAGVTDVQMRDALKILDMSNDDVAYQLDGSKIPGPFKAVMNSTRRLSDELDDDIRVFRAMGGAKTLVLGKFAYSTERQIKALIETKLSFKDFISETAK